MCCEAVPFVELSDEDKIKIELELCGCNSVLAKHHDSYKSNNGLVRHKKSDFFKLVMDRYRPGQGVQLNGMSIPADDVVKIARIKEMQWEMICAFSRLIKKLAGRWARKTTDRCLGLEDLESEAMEAAVHASLYFNGEKRFSTFLHHCVSRRLSKVCNRTTGLSGLSRKAVRLKQEYNRLKNEEGATFDSVVHKMGLNEKEVRQLRSSLCILNTESDVVDEGEFVVIDNSAGISDYIGDSSITELASKLDLTDLEKAVLEGFMNSSTSRLGIGSLSKGLINPKTNKPYSRMSFTFAWKRIKKKIADAYGRAA